MVQLSRSIKRLLSPYSIANQKEADVPILLQNMSAHRVILPKNHVLGTATPFEGEMDDHLHVHGLSEDDSTECKTSRQLPNYMLDLEKRSAKISLRVRLTEYIICLSNFKMYLLQMTWT